MQKKMARSNADLQSHIKPPAVVNNCEHCCSNFILASKEAEDNILRLMQEDPSTAIADRKLWKRMLEGRIRILSSITHLREHGVTCNENCSTRTKYHGRFSKHFALIASGMRDIYLNALRSQNITQLEKVEFADKFLKCSARHAYRKLRISSNLPCCNLHRICTQCAQQNKKKTTNFTPRFVTQRKFVLVTLTLPRIAGVTKLEDHFKIIQDGLERIRENAKRRSLRIAESKFSASHKEGYIAGIHWQDRAHGACPLHLHIIVSSPMDITYQCSIGIDSLRSMITKTWRCHAKRLGVSDVKRTTHTKRIKPDPKNKRRATLRASLENTMGYLTKMPSVNKNLEDVLGFCRTSKGKRLIRRYGNFEKKSCKRK